MLEEAVRDRLDVQEISHLTKSSVAQLVETLQLRLSEIRSDIDGAKCFQLTRRPFVELFRHPCLHSILENSCDACSNSSASHPTAVH